MTDLNEKCINEGYNFNELQKRTNHMDLFLDVHLDHLYRDFVCFVSNLGRSGDNEKKNKQGK